MLLSLRSPLKRIIDPQNATCNYCILSFVLSKYRATDSDSFSAASDGIIWKLLLLPTTKMVKTNRIDFAIIVSSSMYPSEWNLLIA